MSKRQNNTTGGNFLRHGRKVRRPARGVALLLVMIAIGIAMVIAFSFLAVQATATDISRNIVNAAQARAIAESGLSMAISYVKNNTTWRGVRPQNAWVSTQALGGGSFTVSGNDGADTNGDGAIDNGNTNFNDASHPLTLTSMATYKGAKYTVKAVMYPSASTIKVGMSVLGTSGQTLTLSNGALLDSYDSGLGNYGGSNVGSAAQITTNSPSAGTVSVTGGSRLAGTVYAPPGADPTQTVSVVWCTYTGTTQNQTAMVSAPTISVPDLGASIGNKTYPGGVQGTLGANMHCNNFTLGNGVTLTITAPNVVIVSEGNFSVGGGSVISVQSGASLKVYCKGALTIDTGADNKVAGDNLSRLTFYNLSTTAVNLTGGGTFQGVLISPNANVAATNGFRLFGAVISKSITLGGGCAFHQDLRITSGTDSVSVAGAGSSYRIKWLANW